MLSERVAEAGFASGSTVVMGLDELERLTREIQDSVMAIRAQPVKPVFQRMSRIVHLGALAVRHGMNGFAGHLGDLASTRP